MSIQFRTRNSNIQPTGLTGACCIPAGEDAGCEDGKTYSECTNVGGIFQGVSVICSDVDCSKQRSMVVLGACCACDGSCVDEVTEDWCTSRQLDPDTPRASFHAGYKCHDPLTPRLVGIPQSGVECPSLDTFDCCVDGVVFSGICNETICRELGGATAEFGQGCDNSNLVAHSGACCNIAVAGYNRPCHYMDAQDPQWHGNPEGMCVSLGGSFYQDELCADGFCARPLDSMHACCRHNECFNLSKEICENSYGIYMGEVGCRDAGCGNIEWGACTTDSACIQTDMNTCHEYSGEWFAGYGCDSTSLKGSFLESKLGKVCRVFGEPQCVDNITETQAIEISISDYNNTEWVFVEGGNCDECQEIYRCYDANDEVGMCVYSHASDQISTNPRNRSAFITTRLWCRRLAAEWSPNTPISSIFKGCGTDASHLNIITTLPYNNPDSFMDGYPFNYYGSSEDGYAVGSCSVNGICGNNKTKSDCQNQGGIYMGNGTHCSHPEISSDSEDSGACCCHGLAVCQNSTEHDCSQCGGKWCDRPCTSIVGDTCDGCPDAQSDTQRSVVVNDPSYSNYTTWITRKTTGQFIEFISSSYADDVNVLPSFYYRTDFGIHPPMLFPSDNLAIRYPTYNKAVRAIRGKSFSVNESANISAIKTLSFIKSDINGRYSALDIHGVNFNLLSGIQKLEIMPDQDVAIESVSNTIKELNLQGSSHSPIQVTVEPKPTGGNHYVINGVARDTLFLYRGHTYRFDLSDLSLISGEFYSDTHPLRFSETMNGEHGGGIPFTQGLAINRNVGVVNAYVEITIDANTPETLYYYCLNHSEMGGKIEVRNHFENKSLNISAKTQLKKIFINDVNINTLTLPDSDTINILHCAGNNIDYIDITSHPYIYSLDVSYNQLSSIDLSNFGSFDGHGSIDISNNNITLLSLPIFYGETRLQYLDGSDNPLVIATIQNNTKIDVIDLSYTNLANLDIPTRTEVKELYLNNSRIGSINMFDTVDNTLNMCRIIDVSNNDLTTVPFIDESSIPIPKNIEYLNLANNSLSSSSINSLIDALKIAYPIHEAKKLVINIKNNPGTFSKEAINNIRDMWRGKLTIIHDGPPEKIGTGGSPWTPAAR